MKKIYVLFLILVGCASTPEEDAQWAAFFTELGSAGQAMQRQQQQELDRMPNRLGTDETCTITDMGYGRYRKQCY